MHNWLNNKYRDYKLYQSGGVVSLHFKQTLVMSVALTQEQQNDGSIHAVVNVVHIPFDRSGQQLSRFEFSNPRPRFWDTMIGISGQLDNEDLSTMSDGGYAVRLYFKILTNPVFIISQLPDNPPEA